MRLRLLTWFLAVAAAGFGADRDFDRLVSAIEHHYGAKQTHVPLMGMANLFLKVTHPAGASGVHLAIFEDMPLGAFRDYQRLDQFMEDGRGGMHELVVTHSRRDGESTYILAGEVGKNTRILIATFERYEATVIEAEVNMDLLIKLIDSPGEAHGMFGAGDEDRN